MSVPPLQSKKFSELSQKDRVDIHEQESPIQEPPSSVSKVPRIPKFPKQLEMNQFVKNSPKLEKIDYTEALKILDEDENDFDFKLKLTKRSNSLGSPKASGSKGKKILDQFVMSSKTKNVGSNSIIGINSIDAQSVKSETWAEYQMKTDNKRVTKDDIRRLVEGIPIKKFPSSSYKQPIFMTTTSEELRSDYLGGQEVDRDGRELRSNKKNGELLNLDLRGLGHSESEKNLSFDPNEYRKDQFPSFSNSKVCKESQSKLFINQSNAKPKSHREGENQKDSANMKDDDQQLKESRLDTFRLNSDRGENANLEGQIKRLRQQLNCNLNSEVLEELNKEIEEKDHEIMKLVTEADILKMQVYRMNEDSNRDQRKDERRLSYPSQNNYENYKAWAKVAKLQKNSFFLSDLLDQVYETMSKISSALGDDKKRREIELLGRTLKDINSLILSKNESLPIQTENDFRYLHKTALADFSLLVTSEKSKSERTRKNVFKDSTESFVDLGSEDIARQKEYYKGDNSRDYSLPFSNKGYHVRQKSYEIPSSFKQQQQTAIEMENEFLKRKYQDLSKDYNLMKDKYQRGLGEINNLRENLNKQKSSRGSRRQGNEGYSKHILNPLKNNSDKQTNLDTSSNPRRVIRSSFTQASNPLRSPPTTKKLLSFREMPTPNFSKYGKSNNKLISNFNDSSSNKKTNDKKYNYTLPSTGIKSPATLNKTQKTQAKPILVSARNSPPERSIRPSQNHRKNGKIITNVNILGSKNNKPLSNIMPFWPNRLNPGQYVQRNSSSNRGLSSSNPYLKSKTPERNNIINMNQEARKMSTSPILVNGRSHHIRPTGLNNSALRGHKITIRSTPPRYANLLNPNTRRVTGGFYRPDDNGDERSPSISAQFTDYFPIGPDTVIKQTLKIARVEECRSCDNLD